MRPRFTLRLLLIVVTLIAILFGASANFVYRVKDQARRHKAAIKKLQSLGVDIEEEGYPFSFHIEQTAFESFVQKWIEPDAYRRAGRAEVDQSNPFAGTPKALEFFPDVYGLNMIEFKDLVLNDESCAKLSKLPELIIVKVDRLAIHSTAVDGLKKLRRLSELEIMEPITNDTAERLAYLPHLNTLDFDASRLGQRGADALARLNELKTVKLRRTLGKPASLAAMLKCEQLTELSLYFDASGDETLLNELKHADKISNLSIWTLKQPPDSLIPSLSEMKSLKELYIRSNFDPAHLSNLAPLTKCTQLERLDLAFVEVDAQKLFQLAPLKNLRRVKFKGNLSEGELQRFLSSHPACEIDMVTEGNSDRGHLGIEYQLKDGKLSSRNYNAYSF